MSRSFLLDENLTAYVRAHSEPVDEVLADLIVETGKLGDVAGMQSAQEVGGLLTTLVHAIGARNAIEIGTFTGYSAICIARGLAPGGRLVCCDVNDDWTSIAREYWKRAGLSDAIELRLGPAADSLAAIPEQPTYDFAYIDADKPGYRTYVELLHPRLRANGLIAVDNVLWGGRVADSSVDDDNTKAIREFNDAMAADDRWDTQLLALGDGLTLLRKR
jgi:predicted O-methyltransferase YrrM